MNARKNYIDNLRTTSVLLLFLFHAFMVYNDWGESFYIHGENLFIPSRTVNFLWMWMMPLLFVIAGISSRYALQKRSPGEYAKERVKKLLLPLIFGMLILVPVQSFIGGLFWSGDTQYFDYFTTLTDFTGYDGAFTPAHLWFILFLFVISLVSLPFMWLYLKKGKGTLGNRMPLVTIMLLGLLPCLGNIIFDISGKSPTEYLALFLLGFFFLSNDAVLEKLDKYRFILLGIAVLATGLTWSFDNILYELACWFWVIAIIGLGRHYLNFTSKQTRYLSKSSFGVYLFHQPWIVITGYLTLKLTANYWVQTPIILLSSIALTYLTYILASKAAPLRWMFGLK